MRAQLLDAKVDHLDAVIITHDHADHTHGIDDLRFLAYASKKKVNVYFDKATGDTLRKRFGYCFKTDGLTGYPPIAEPSEIEPGEALVIKGKGGKLTLLPFLQEHGSVCSLGIRCGAIAYSSDVSDLVSESAAVLEGLDTWIVDALRYDPHPSHFSVADALSWIKRIRPRRAVLTHMHIDLDYDELGRRTPGNVEVAYDGMVIPFEDGPFEGH